MLRGVIQLAQERRGLHIEHVVRAGSAGLLVDHDGRSWEIHMYPGISIISETSYRSVFKWNVEGIDTYLDITLRPGCLSCVCSLPPPARLGVSRYVSFLEGTRANPELFPSPSGQVVQNSRLSVRAPRRVPWAPLHPPLDD